MNAQEKQFRAANPRERDLNFDRPIIDQVLKAHLPEFGLEHFTKKRHPVFTFETYADFKYEYDDGAVYLLVEWNDQDGGNGEITDLVMGLGDREDYELTEARKEDIETRIQYLLAKDEQEGGIEKDY